MGFGEGAIRTSTPENWLVFATPKHQYAHTPLYSGLGRNGSGVHSGPRALNVEQGSSPYRRAFRSYRPTLSRQIRVAANQHALSHRSLQAGSLCYFACGCPCVEIAVAEPEHRRLASGKRIQSEQTVRKGVSEGKSRLFFRQRQ